MDGDGSEVDWFVGYSPPAENFQTHLEKILRGENTFKALQTAYAANPKDVGVVFRLGLKWSERNDTAKAQEKYNEVVALDPEGKAGSFTDEDDTHITAPCTDFARFEIAAAGFTGAKPDPALIKAFISDYPKSPLVRTAYRQMASYYISRAAKEDAEAYFAEFTARFPGDAEAVSLWLARVLRDKGPADKADELAGRLWALTVSNPQPRFNQLIAQAYDLAGDKAKAAQAYGKGFMDSQVENLAYSLLTYANYWADRKENLESAEAMAETALKLQPGGDPYFFRSVAGVYLKAGDEAKALGIYGPAWLEKSTADKADQDINGYASFWMRQGKNLESALAAAQKTVELQPKAYYYWSTLSDVHAKMNNKAEAVKAAEKAVELAPATAKAPMQRKLEMLKSPGPDKK